MAKIKAKVKATKANSAVQKNASKNITAKQAPPVQTVVVQAEQEIPAAETPADHSDTGPIPTGQVLVSSQKEQRPPVQAVPTKPVTIPNQTVQILPDQQVIDQHTTIYTQQVSSSKTDPIEQVDVAQMLPEQQVINKHTTIHTKQISSVQQVVNNQILQNIPEQAVKNSHAAINNQTTQKVPEQAIVDNFAAVNKQNAPGQAVTNPHAVINNQTTQKVPEQAIVDNFAAVNKQNAPEQAVENPHAVINNQTTQKVPEQAIVDNFAAVNKQNAPEQAVENPHAVINNQTTQKVPEQAIVDNFAAVNNQNAPEQAVENHSTTMSSQKVQTPQKIDNEQPIQVRDEEENLTVPLIRKAKDIQEMDLEDFVFLSLNVPFKEGNFFYAESYKTLRANLQFTGSQYRNIAVTSSASGEGKTDTSFHLAASLAEMGKKVLYLDTDLRKSNSHRFIDHNAYIYDLFGLSHYLSGQCSLDQIIYCSNIANLCMVFSGPLVKNATELLLNDRYSQIFESIERLFDYIIIDTPPIGSVIDAAHIGRQADGVLFVVSSGQTKRKNIQRSIHQLKLANCKILGFIMNKAQTQNSHYAYYGAGEME
ncbi:hypothetical protein FACS189418_0750 [Clostridia bacterium]|nr:hypothetical protein FACS189418_0750 [Clostridia bacterium]